MAETGKGVTAGKLAINVQKRLSRAQEKVTRRSHWTPLCPELKGSQWNLTGGPDLTEPPGVSGCPQRFNGCQQLQLVSQASTKF